MCRLADGPDEKYMLARPKVVADFKAEGTFFAKSVAQSSLPLPSPCTCRAYLPCATCWLCTATVPPFRDVSHFAGSTPPVSKSSQKRPAHDEAPPAPVAVEPPPIPPPARPPAPACAPWLPAEPADDPPSTSPPTPPEPT